MTGGAAAHGKKKHADKVQMVPANLDMVENEFGKTGDPNKVSRTIAVSMSDEMKFEPSHIEVKVGETIRFLAANKGEVLHELVIGRTSDLMKHAVLMEKFPNMEHAEPYMAHADEGQTAEIIWTFSKPGTFEYGCLIPGHYDSGMKGSITVVN
ncbi:MAG: cupredoxin family protein [Rhizobiales bacterium]|nr:cupredoxin family protein [Hyphomicrobiales bacterium]